MIIPIIYKQTCPRGQQSIHDKERKMNDNNHNKHRGGKKEAKCIAQNLFTRKKSRSPLNPNFLSAEATAEQAPTFPAMERGREAGKAEAEEEESSKRMDWATIEKRESGSMSRVEERPAGSETEKLRRDERRNA